MNQNYENFFSLFVRYCTLGDRRGWHDYSGGAMSMLLDNNMIRDIQSGLDFSREFETMLTPVPELAKCFLMVTASRLPLGMAEERPDEVCGIIQVSPDGAGVRTVLGFVSGARPTRDLPAHLAVHAVLRRRNRTRTSVVYHCHPSNVVALSYLLSLEEEEFNDTLSRSSVQFPDTLPDGLGILDELVLDPSELAKRTAQKFENHDAVLWAFHGLISGSDNLAEAFGITETVEKAAEIRMKILQVQGSARQEPVRPKLECAYPMQLQHGTKRWKVQ